MILSVIFQDFAHYYSRPVRQNSEMSGGGWPEILNADLQGFIFIFHRDEAVYILQLGGATHPSSISYCCWSLCYMALSDRYH